jgi:Domain of unknown function (DUF4167)
MRPQNKRGRGRGGHNPNHPGNPNRPRGPHRQQNFDSNGPGVKIRGNAYQVFERYIALAREAQTSGDRIAAENLYQHAEHYYRILNADGQFAQRASATPADTEMQMGEGEGQMPGQPSQGGYDQGQPGFDQQPQPGGYDHQGQPQPQGGYEQRPPQSQGGGYEARGPQGGGYDNRGPQGSGYDNRGPQGGFEQGDVPAFLGGGGGPGQGGYEQPRQQGRGPYEGGGGGGGRQGRFDRRGRRGGYDRQNPGGGQGEGNEPQPYSGESQTHGAEPQEPAPERRRDPGSEPQPG